MSNSDLVRFSRDGDQFHYLWASRRCLQLLSPSSGLVAISIEGPSASETPLEEGEELIDVGEYYGSENIETATLIKYIQLKHSTQTPDEPWQPSGLKKTIEGFSDRYKAIKTTLGGADLTGRLEFWFVSNRPIISNFLETISDAASSATPRHKKDMEKLELFTGLTGSELSSFCKLLRLDGNHDGYLAQRSILAQDISGYLPDADVDAPIQLKELVTQKALSESAGNPSITKMDVLRALKTDEDRLFPAPNLIKEPREIVPREQESSIVEQITNSSGIPVLVHAAGGVGKSVIANRIKLGLPEGSVSITYDCFGDGQYRSATAYRHRHKDAFVQIANELAGIGLCHPLIPTPNADPPAYLKAFLYRLNQAVSIIKAKHPNALLCIVIDAADNAQMAAEELGEARSFARDLLRANMPDDVRIVMLCRTHRQSLLDPPYNALHLELRPFNREETSRLLRSSFADATDHDVDEFHRLSSHNPRVMATALSRGLPLQDILKSLGPNPTTVEDTIASLLENAVAELRDRNGPTERNQIDLICSGLAILRPLVPIPVLAQISGVDEGAIRSFATDIGRPLLLLGDTIQFYDEPAETWFRERFKPDRRKVAELIEAIRPLAAKNAYVASSLPQLMLEANQLSELVNLALSSSDLPEGNPLVRRDVELQRLQFALIASLRAKKYTDAAKLAYKAGGETAGDARQKNLLQENTDLASIFLETDRIQELVSRRIFSSGWTGSHHAFNAGILSGRMELLGDARSHLRMAHEWVRNWSRLPDELRQKEKFDDEDIVEMATAHFNIHGAEACFSELRGWKPREVVFRCSQKLARRFIDNSRYDELDQLATEAANNICSILGITIELREVNKNPPKPVVDRTLRLLLSSRVLLSERESMSHDHTVLRAVTTMVEAGIVHSSLTNEELATILKRYLPETPPRWLGSRFGQSRFPLLHAYSLHAALANTSLELEDLAHPEIREELSKDSYSASQDSREFKEIVGALLPWHIQWAKALLGLIPNEQLGTIISETKKASDKASKPYYGVDAQTVDEISFLWFKILITIGGEISQGIIDYITWLESMKKPVSAITLTRLSRIAARQNGLESLSLGFATEAFSYIQGESMDAEEKISRCTNLCRAVLAVSIPEADGYFNAALEVANRIGGENLQRWSAILDLSDKAANPISPSPEIAYKLARAAELMYQYVARDKHMEWWGTVQAMAGLCPASSFAILSRWRDRGFGDAQRLLPAAVHFLLERRILPPKVAIALFGFQAKWNEVLLFQKALEATTTKEEKKVIFNQFHEYFVLLEPSIKEWKKYKEVTDSHGLQLVIPDAYKSTNAQEPRLSRPEDFGYGIAMDAANESEKSPFDQEFDNLDFNSSNNIGEFLRKIKEHVPNNHIRFFLEEALKRIKAGNEALFIRAVTDLPEFDLYDFRYLIDNLPPSWVTRVSIKPAIVDLFRKVCSRNKYEVFRLRNYEVLPFGRVAQLTGLSEGEIVDIVLSAIGESGEYGSSERLFALVGLIALRLNNNEALEALTFSLSLFEPMLRKEDGDGPWSTKLSPPKDIDAAVAGYIWAGLGVPEIKRRWEAAHVVKGLAVLGQNSILNHLASFAIAGERGLFSDSKLYFYRFHALQWLMIAFDRIALENPTSLIPHMDFLSGVALGENQHVLIRGFAASSALKVIQHGGIDANPEIVLQLQEVNTSKIPGGAADPGHQVFEVQDLSSADIPRGFEFYFDLDFGPYWFAGLGRCFGLSEAYIKQEVAKQIIQGWGLAGYDSWEKDERGRIGYFKDGETYHSHGSYPKADDLQFYLSYHAMMTVAGRLLSSLPLIKEEDEVESVFSAWLADYSLTRSDGKWLSDRRDPIPQDLSVNQCVIPEEEWRWSVTKEDFNRYLGESSDRLTLWGGWTSTWDTLKEDVSIRSAMVTPQNSEALMRALQTAESPHDYSIPDAEDHLQIETEDFKLKGWVLDRNQESGIDQHDPWSGEINFPSLAPAEWIVDRLKMESDPEEREWRKQNDPSGATMIWSQAWSKMEEDDGGHRGQRLQVSQSSMAAMLKTLNYDLIIKVTIDRRKKYLRYSSRQDDGLGYLLPYTKLFILKNDGHIYTL
ncbi:hypothetical protein [Rufibacter psychrotolerans]|uniref:hypothetical protein n=1 Tax=Rufibacter psychrotolerans TaxID=2812556 RepID=UPI001967E3E8|nr:hypothetical protein [Rufibacter sp. SYSU D00308]